MEADDAGASDSSEDLWIRRIVVPTTPHTLKLREDFAGDTGLGGTIWDPTYILIEVLAVSKDWDVSKARIVELGSGCGALGIAVHKLGAKEVVLTDRGVDMLEHLRYNVSLNTEQPNDSRIRVVELDWIKASENKQLLLQLGTFDIILASECIYNQGIILPFLEVVAGLGYGVPPDSSRTPVILVCGVISDATWKEFDVATGQGSGWRREEVPIPVLDEKGVAVGERAVTREDRKCWRLFLEVQSRN